MKKVLLHTCCAPCSAPILEWMLGHDYYPTLFFYNPNIFPEWEYLVRKNELIRYAEMLGVTIIDGDYNHDRWLTHMKGLEDQPERGSRCGVCFRVRLEETAALAHERGYPLFTTTLAGSRWKNFTQIAEAGYRAAALFDGIEFWDKDWKKGGLTERRRVLLQQHGFYNQTYCGCEFSFRDGK